MTEAPAQVAETATTRVWRVEVRPLDPTDDPLGRSVLAEAGEMHLAPNLRHVRTARLYLVETDLDQPTIERVAGQLLSDPVSEQWRLGAADVEPDASLVEVHYLPGVMDPVAHSTRDAILDMVGEGHACEVRTAARYDLAGATAEQADAIGRRLLANPVIQSIHDVPRAPERFPEPRPYEFNLIRNFGFPFSRMMKNELSISIRYSLFKSQ